MQTRLRPKRRRFAPFISAVILAVTVTAAPAPGAKAPDYQGLRFRCGDRAAKRVCLPYLRSECSLRFVAGETIPARIPGRDRSHGASPAAVCSTPHSAGSTTSRYSAVASL